jgi:hypothetical protein
VQLFSQASGGSPLTASPLRVANVNVVQGVFSAPISVPEAELGAHELWIEIAIKEQGTVAVTLGGRQRLLSVPYSAMAGRAATAQSAATASSASGALRTEIDGFVEKAGDQMTGALVVDGAITSSGDLTAAGAIWVGGTRFCPRRLVRCFWGLNGDHFTWVDSEAECAGGGLVYEGAVMILAQCP